MCRLENFGNKMFWSTVLKVKVKGREFSSVVPPPASQVQGPQFNPGYKKPPKLKVNSLSEFQGLKYTLHVFLCNVLV